MLDDLRRYDDTDFEEVEEEEFPVDFDAEASAQSDGRGFLGMTAGERALLAFFFLVNVLILGFALLLATGRIAF